MAELRYVDWDGLVYYDGKIKEFIRDNAESYLKMGGIIPSKDLPDPSWQNLNYIYKITDSFVSTDRFEHPGYVYPAGTWVQCINYKEDERWLYTIFNEETIGGTADLSNYYTKSEVNEKIEEAIASIEIPEVDLNNYYTKEEVNTLIPDVSNLATKEELEAVQNVAGSNSVKLFAIESDLVDINQRLDSIETPDLSDYATKDEVAAVEAKVDAIVIPEVPKKVSELENDAGYITAKDIPETDLSNYYNKTETENLIADAVKDIEHPTVDLEGYATEDWVNEQGFIKEIPSEYITESELDAKGYLTEHQDLSEYAKKSDIPQPELFVVDYNAPDFAAALEAYNNGKLLLLTNAAPDPNGYAVMNYVRDDLITFTKFLMSRSETYGAFNTYYLHSDNTWEVSKEVKLNKVEANVSDNATADLTSIRVGKEVYRIPETDLSEYITETELLEKGYITDAALTDYAKTSDIPTKTSQLTNDSNFLTEHQDISSKADNVPFTTDMFVTKPQGDFISGENLNGLSVITILTKLLGLQAPPTPDEPDVPDEPVTIVDKIIKNQLGMYQVNEAAELIEIPYNYVTYDNTSYDVAPDVDYFYQKLDENGEVIESGYQHVSDENDSMYYLIALPQGVNFNENVSVKVWDETSNAWADVTDTFEMSSDLQFIEDALVEAELSMPAVPEGYTLWIDSSLNTCTGSDYRFIINE